jgi:hypothetical protein
MKSFVSSLAVTIACLSAMPTVLTLATPGSAAANNSSRVAQAALHPATQGGTIAEQLNRHVVSQMSPTPATPADSSQTMPAPKDSESQPPARTKYAFPGCEVGEDMDSFAAREALQLCKFGS